MSQDSQSRPKMRVSKLVTLSAKYSGELSPMLPVFTYTGTSRSMHTDVQVAFPSHKGNMMFYEHFQEDKAFPCMLSFMCLGMDDGGKVISDFGRYTHVDVVEFSKEIKSVNLMLQIINQLPNCREVKIFFDDNNILLSAEDSHMIENKFDVTSHTVKVLKIIRFKETEDLSLDINNTKVSLLLKNAYWNWTGFEYLYVDGMEGGGKTYDMIRQFCEMRNLIKHNVKISDGKVYCKPQLNVPSTSSSTKIKQEPYQHQLGSSSTRLRDDESQRLPLDLTFMKTSNNDGRVSPGKKIEMKGTVDQAEQRPVASLSHSSFSTMPGASNSLLPDEPSSSLVCLRSLYDDYSSRIPSDEEDEIEEEEVTDLYSSSPPIPRYTSDTSNDAWETLDSAATRRPGGVNISPDELQNMLDAASSSAEAPPPVPVVDLDEVEYELEGIRFCRRKSTTVKLERMSP